MESYDTQPSPEEFDRLAGKALVDPEFREYLFADPQAAAGELGIILSQAQIDHIKTLDPSLLDGLANDIDAHIGPANLLAWA